VLRPKGCTAKIQLSFGEKATTKLNRKRGSKSPKFMCSHSKSFSDNSALEHRKSSHSRIAQSVSIALKPPTTLSSGTHSSSLTSRVNPSNLDINTKVSYDNNSNVFIEIESDNIPSLRASINSYLRLADASYRCIAGGNLES
jgi:tRNA threonylcarbamoyladenosine modification (KEOPS) complex  Pcc1 subunit